MKTIIDFFKPYPSFSFFLNKNVALRTRGLNLTPLTKSPFLIYGYSTGTTEKSKKSKKWFKIWFLENLMKITVISNSIVRGIGLNRLFYDQKWWFGEERSN